MTSAVSRDMAVSQILPVGTKGNADQTENSIAFADTMAKATQSDLSGFATDAKSQSENEIQNVFDKTSQSGSKRVEDSAKTETKKTEDTNKNPEEKVEETSDDLKKKIAEKLGVSEEDVENAMNALGLTFADLMQNGNMALLVGQLTGMDAISALTDEDAFLQITELTNMVCEDLGALTEELGVSTDQLKDLFAEALVNQEGMVATDVSMETSEGPVVEVVTEQVTKDVPKEAAERPITAVKQESEDANVKTESLAQTETLATENKAEKKDTSGQNSSNDSSMQQMNQPQVQTEAASAEPIFEADMEQSVRAQEIIDQIADYVKVHHSEQLTQMEIELNPASLGNIHLQVATKDGVVTAQMIAQNEAVKSALESQLLELRENLEAQGLKVSEVEVTVASHQFEENLDQQGKNAEEDAMQQSRKNSRRILNLDEIDENGGLLEDGQELTQAEKLQAEMMRMGGNKLNFRV